MTTEKRSTLTLGLKKKLDESQDKNGNISQTTTDKRSKLTLGLKKKQPQDKNSQTTTNKYSRLTLGLRKKTALTSFPNKENEQITSETRPKFVLGRKKHEFIPPPKKEPLKMEKFHPGPFSKRSTIRMAKTQGRLEVNIKINELPNWRETVKRGWHLVHINADGQIVQMKIRPRIWNQVLAADKEYPMWIASITGKMGQRIKNGFELLEPAVQVYEKKPKQEVNTFENEE